MEIISAQVYCKMMNPPVPLPKREYCHELYCPRRLTTISRCSLEIYPPDPWQWPHTYTQRCQLIISNTSFLLCCPGKRMVLTGVSLAHVLNPHLCCDSLRWLRMVIMSDCSWPVIMTCQVNMAPNRPSVEVGQGQGRRGTHPSLTTSHFLCQHWKPTENQFKKCFPYPN